MVAILQRTLRQARGDWGEFNEEWADGDFEVRAETQPLAAHARLGEPAGAMSLLEFSLQVQLISLPSRGERRGGCKNSIAACGSLGVLRRWVVQRVVDHQARPGRERRGDDLTPAHDVLDAPPVGQ